MAFIGEIVLSKLLETLTGNLVDSALNFVADHKQVKQQLKEWQSKLPDIQAVLNDAEEKQIKDDPVKQWLDDLQDLAYDVDDILDEFAYEELHLKIQNTHAQGSTSRVRKLIPTCCTGCYLIPSSFLLNNSMIRKIKGVTARLNSLTERRSILGLSKIMSRGATSKGKEPRLQQTSVVDEAVEHVGRHNEKQEMLDLLKSSNNSDGVFILSIVAMGGMGKTTLAQLVYNSIKGSFDHHAWVCVSDDFDVVNITKTILESITSVPCASSDFNKLQVMLKENLYGKRFLLVLDDIWNEDENAWSILRTPFGAGTKIIVTTRHQNVSSIVDPVKAFHLDKLSHDECLSIFTQKALKARNFDAHPELKEIGEKIVRRCNGLPLAAKALGSLLRSVEDHDEWERIYKSEIWDLPEDPSRLVPALMLSYHHLPSHLKRCFAYCSILPKDYEFEEEEIILLWRAEGFLQQRDIGKQYFDDLVSRSFFQKSCGDKSGFVMHDLINDLAQLVAGELCLKLKGDKQQMFSNRTRHSSYLVSRYDIVKKFEAFEQANALRTFLPLRMPLLSDLPCFLTDLVPVNLLPRLVYLRVLSLSGYEITELCDEVFENLKHLRYLNFSRTKIKCLPDSLCSLYHLETLLLKGCSKLQKLPSKMENLVNLHYLDIRGADEIKRMPFGIGKLRNLERLSDLVIGEGDGHYVGELKILSSLRGDFCLSGLENVDSQYAGEANLDKKPGINRLVLEWSTDFKKATRKKEVEEQVLDSLRPPKKLEQLFIKNYGGTKFSSWIANSSFNKLASLKLYNCRNCKSLPSIGRLPFLKEVSIIGFDVVEKVGVDLFQGNQSLETLYFESMPNWKEWELCEGDEQASQFTNLRELSIKECPQLLSRLPTHLRSLKKLEIYECRRLVVSISSFPALHELSVRGCEELVDECCSSSSSSAVVAEEVSCLQRVSLSDISKFSIRAERIMSRFANSEHFTIDGWKELDCLSELNGLSLVGHRFIEIKECPKLVFLETEEEIKNLSDVEYLVIENCPRLERLPEILYAFTLLSEMNLYDCSGLVCLAKSNFPPALKKLQIGRCENLKYLVHEEEDKKSISTCLLQHLLIEKCESLICISSRADICNGLLRLFVIRCSKLSSLFSNAKLPINLKHLLVKDCPMLECIAQDFHEATHLDSITICSCEKLQYPLSGLDKLSHLRCIEFWTCSNLVSLEESGLPWTTTILRSFRVVNCPNFGALPSINNFSSLRELILENCSAEISFPVEGFPTNLTSLSISKSLKIYTSLVQWGLHRLTSLQELCIHGEGCSDVVSFPEQRIGMRLPPSLTQLAILKFENLEFMCSKAFENLTSLQILWIWNCPKLKSLPEKAMLLSLEELRIEECPLLVKGCRRRRGKGREWSKIAHIPHVVIDNKDVIPRGGLD